MHTKSRLIPILGAVALALVAACGTSSTGGGTTSGGGGLAGCTGSVTVASDLPTSGGDAAIGGGTENGVRAAVLKAQQEKLLGGCTINYIPKNDASVAKGEHDPALGAQNMIALTTNPAVVGVVGPFNSSVAIAEMPIANRAGMLLLSPANTNPGLTIAGSRPDVDTNSLRPTGKVTYYRIIWNDIAQGADDAQISYKELNARKAYIIDDQEAYGKGLADFFEKYFKQDGGTVLKHVALPGTTKDFKAQLTEAKGLGADLLFFGGVAANGSGIIYCQMKDVGLTAKYMSGDGTVDPQFFKDCAGTNGDGAYATSAPDATKTSAGAGFTPLYDASFADSSRVVYSPYGYDAMRIVLNAVKAVLVDNGGKVPTDSASFRSKVIAKVAATKYDGFVGHIEFDQNGDTTNHAFGLYSSKGGQWTQSEVVQAPPV